MTHDEKLAALQAEIARQDEQLAEFEAAMTALRGFDIDIPQAFLRELDAITDVAPAPTHGASPTMIFGAIRA